MPDRRRKAQSAQSAHSTNAQYNLLRNAHLAVATVEAGRQLTIGGSIRFDIGIQQIEWNTTDLDAPDLGMDAPSRQINANQDLIAIGAAGRSCWHLGEDQVIVEGRLNTLASDALPEVALGVEEAYSH